MPVVAASSKDEFDTLLQGTPKFAVVYFWASWATPCVQMTAVFEKIASFGGDAAFISVEAEAVPLVAQKFNVTSVPMIAFAKPDGTVFDVVVGAHAPVLVGKVNQYKDGPLPDQAVVPPPPAVTVAPAVAPAANPVSDIPLTEQRNEELRALTLTHRVIAVELLVKEGVEFGCFDILADQSVRNDLKKFSEWPTYPQLFVNGQLVGGLDIMKELKESGELGASLQ